MDEVARIAFAAGLTRSTQDSLAIGLWRVPASDEAASSAYTRTSARDSSFRLLDAAWEAGIHWIDIAPSYGNGRAIGLVGAWMRERGLAFDVVLKLGRPIVGGTPTSRVGIGSMLDEFAGAVGVLGLQPAAILVKDPPEAFFASDVRGFLQHLSREANTPLVGVSTHRLDLARVLPSPSTTTIAEIEYNGVVWPAAARAASALRSQGWSVWGMQPLAYGFLARRRMEFDRSDWRSKLSSVVRAALWRGAEVFIQTMERRFPDPSTAQLAIGFCLADQSLDRVVVGPRSAEQLEDAVAALQLCADRHFVEFVEDLRNAFATIDTGS